MALNAFLIGSVHVVGLGASFTVSLVPSLTITGFVIGLPVFVSLKMIVFWDVALTYLLIAPKFDADEPAAFFVAL